MTKQALIELALQVSGQGAVDGLTKSTANLKALIDEAAKAFERGDIAADELEATVDKLGRQLAKETQLLDRIRAAQDQVAKSAVDMGDAVELAMAEIAQDSGKAEAAYRRLDTASARAGRSTADLGRAALESGRIIQDFAQGGVAGILNNVEGFAAALGVGSGLAGAFTILGVAAYLAAPSVKAFFASLADGSNKVPEAADAVQRMTDRLKENNKELDDLRGKQSLTNTELARFNELTAETTRLEKERDAERDKRKRVDAAVGSVSDEQKARAKAFDDSLQGQGGQFLEALKQAYARDAEASIRQETARSQRERDKLFRSGASNAQIGAFENSENARLADFARTARGNNDQLATDLFDKLLRGDEGAQRTLARLQMNAQGAGLANVASRFDANLQGNANAKIEQQFEEMASKELARLEKLDEKKAEADDKIAAMFDAMTAAELNRMAEQERKQAEKGDAVGQRFDEMAAAEAARQRAEATKRLGETTSIDEQAAVAAAQARGQGGYFDKFGRFVRASPEQQQAVLAQDAATAARRADPTLSREDAMGVGQRIAQEAFARVDRMTEDTAAALRVQNQGLDATQATQMAAFQTLQAVQAMAARVQMLEANARGLGREAAALNRGQVGRRPPFQPQVPTR